MKIFSIDIVGGGCHLVQANIPECHELYRRGAEFNTSKRESRKQKVLEQIDESAHFRSHV